MELPRAKCVRIPEVIRASQLDRITRLALAFLVFLGATVQCWGMAACPQQCCLEMGIGAKAQDDPDCNCTGKNHDHDTGQSKDHHGAAPCCCSHGQPDASIATGSAAITLPVQFQAATLPHHIELGLPPRQPISIRIPFFGDSSPPLAEADPHQGRAPPFA